MGMEMGGIFSLVHAVVLLTVSFFVLLAVGKADSQALKTFGYVIAVLLWVSSALAFAGGLRRPHPMMMKKMQMWETMHHQQMGNQPQQPSNQAVAK